MNISKAKEYLEKNSVSMLRGGKSGARVYELEGNCVLKCVRREDMENNTTYEMYRREALWYETAGKSGLRCLPEVFDIRNTEEEIVILMRHYRTLSHIDIEIGLLRKIMEAIAEIHCAEIPAFLKKERQKARPLTEKQIAESLEGWRFVLREHPGDFDEDALEKIAANINKIIQWHDSEEMGGHINAANIVTSFVFWHQYLHGCTKERVREIYEEMVKTTPAFSAK